MPGKPVAARQKAIKLFSECNEDLKAAAAALKAQWNKKWGKPPTRFDKFVKAWVHKWNDRGSVLSARHPGRTPRLTTDAVNKAGVLFAAGFDTSDICVKGEKPIIQHHGFKNMKEALRMCDELEQLRAKYMVTSLTLYRRIIKAHKEIKRFSRDYKRAFSQKQKQDRRSTAQAWWNMYQREGGAFLSRLVAFDEGCIDIKFAPEYRRYEYGAATDNRMKTVLFAPLCGQAKGGITLWWYVVVNPRVGCVGVYFTTGTTDINRLYKRDYPEPIDGFKVSLCQPWGRGLSKCSAGGKCA